MQIRKLRDDTKDLINFLDRANKTSRKMSEVNKTLGGNFMWEKVSGRKAGGSWPCQTTQQGKT